MSSPTGRSCERAASFQGRAALVPAAVAQAAAEEPESLELELLAEDDDVVEDDYFLSFCLPTSASLPFPHTTITRR